MQRLLSELPQFFITAPQECPYLENRKERKLFVTLDSLNSVLLNNTLSKQGFRRSQNVLYRPACTDCNACLSARIVINNFKVSKSQKRLQKKNVIIKRIIVRPFAKKDHYALFQQYVQARHKAGGMSDMSFSEFSSMVEDSKVSTKLIEYRDANSILLGVCLTDVLDDGVSMVYSFFDPRLKTNSLGTYMILDHINYANELNLKYVYLGYWVQGSNKMQYKASFSGLEVFISQAWKTLTKEPMCTNLNELLAEETISEQLSNIKILDY